MSAQPASLLLRRIARERRRALLPLAIVVAVNVLVYAFVVYPMASRVANIEERSRAAQSDLAAARREFDRANGTLTGKERASRELATFYASVLPRDQAGARRLTTLRLYQLARDAGLDVGRLTVGDTVPSGSTLRQLKVVMDLAGDYEDMRSFIHRLETAREFVVIDNVALSEGADEGALVVNVEASTYYRTAAAEDAAP